MEPPQQFFLRKAVKILHMTQAVTAGFQAADGLLEGQRKLYDEQGSLITSEEYHWGALVHNTERRKL